MKTKRQSTTVKITSHILKVMRQMVLRGEGVIVRYRGQEHGIVAVYNGYLLTEEGHVLEAKYCTIRRGLPGADSKRYKAYKDVRHGLCPFGGVALDYSPLEYSVRHYSLKSPTELQPTIVAVQEVTGNLDRDLI